MGYTYTPQSLVDLPRLTASAAVVLTLELITAADARKQQLAAAGQTFPTSIARPLARLESACEALEAVLQPYLPSTDPKAAYQADLAVDRAWSALNDLLSGWSKVPAPFNPDPEGTAALRSLLFSEGLTFVQLDYKSQWQQSQARLDALKSAACLETLAALGALPVLENLRRAQEQYGAALGITEVKLEDPSPAVAEHRSAVLAALRDYVTKVVAWVDPEEPGSEELAEALLAPLAAWESRVTKSSSEGAPQTASSSEAGEQSAPPA